MIGTKAMKELSSLKRELKCWENMYERTHGRKPNKDDINDGPKEIKEAYRKYRILKDSLSKEGKEDCKQDDSDNVFGKDLNKKKKEETEALIPFRVRHWADIKPVQLCHGQRPKKGELQDNSDDPCGDKEDATLNRLSGEKVEQDQIVRIDDGCPQVKVLDTSEHNISSSVKKKFSSNFLGPGRHAKNSQKRRATVSSAWLEKYKPELPEDKECDKTSNSRSPKKDLESDNISMVDHDLSDRNDNFSSFNESEGTSCIAAKVATFDAQDSAEVHEDVEKGLAVEKSPEAVNCGANAQTSLEGDHHMQEDKNTWPLKCKLNDENMENNERTQSSTSSKKGRRESAENSSVAASSLSEEANTRAPSQNCGDQAHKNKGLKRKAVHETLDNEKPNKKSRFEPVDAMNNGGESEQKHCDENRVGGNGNRPDSEEELPKIKAQKERRPKSSGTSVKPSSGLVSENFQRLDMKHKSYRRRGGGMTGGAYKRRAWKQIMKSKGEFVPQKSWSSRGRGGGSGRSGVCFKCGQEGHWAKNCRGPKKPRIDPQNCNNDASDAEMEDFEQFPTLDEAAMMAAGVPLPSSNKGDGQADQDLEPEYSDLVVLPHHLPRPVYTPPSPRAAMEPLYQPVDGKPVDPPHEVLSSLNNLGFSSFRPGQQDAVMRILCGLSSLVVLSTGAGKSLCYQLPAFLYSKRSSCLTLVISPLVSLMEDQVTGLPHGLKGACLHTNLTKAQRQKVTEDLCSGKVSVLLLSPEALVGGGSGNGCLPSVSQLPPVAFACIDEAHCVSEWSHNFRPSYLRVCKVLREKFGVRCFLGLTATATRATAASVAEHLGIVHDTGAVIRGAAVPPNLFLSASCDSDRTQALLQLLQGRRFSQCDSIIIYCTRREQTEKLSSTLRTCLQSTKLPSGWDPKEDEKEEKEETTGKKKKTKRKNKKVGKRVVPQWDAECYHAGMTAAQRRRVQKRFMTGQLRVVVATVAFGMGLDKSDVRAIIHYNLPKSFESYVQEIGRAGRDGLPAHCHVFLDPEGRDMCELRRHVYANTVDRSTIKKLISSAFPRCECKKLHEKQKAGRERRVQQQEWGEAFSETFDSNFEAELQAVEMKYHTEQKLEESIDTEQDKQVSESLEVHQDSTINSGVSGETNSSLTSAKESLVSDSISDSDTVASNSTVQGLNSASDATIALEEPTINQNDQTEQARIQRFCGGHEVAMATEVLIQELDMREESIATLLCYLELHPSRWLEVLQPVKSTCTVKFYGGLAQLRLVAQRIPPIAAAVSHSNTTPANLKKTSTLTFNAVEVADKMGWDLDPVCRELRALQWNTSLSRDPSLTNMGQSGILVEFSDLSIHVRAPGDLSDAERDSVCDFLEDRILAEERSTLQQLQFVYDSLKSISCSEYWLCADAVDEESDEQLKTIVKSYFEDPTDKTRKELTELANARKGSTTVTSYIARDKDVNWDGIARDIRALLGVHHDHSFTGRAVARIFHGIDSPCYPAEVWGRDRRFWRKHLDVEFNSLRKFATRELIRLR